MGVIDAVLAKHKGGTLPHPKPTAATKAIEMTVGGGVTNALNEIAAHVFAETLDEKINRVNQDHFVVSVGGDVMVGCESFDHSMGIHRVELISQAAFTLKFKNVAVKISDENENTRSVTLGQAWLVSPNRRQYLNGMATLPGGETPDGVFNLYRGLGIDPISGDVEPILRHIKTVLCAGNSGLAGYLIRWLARAVQHPELPAEVAIVLRGKKGAGKGALWKLLKLIFGAHGMQVAHGRHLVGNFNAHLQSVLLLWADEALFAGDPSTRGALKALITEPTIIIERKGVDAVQARNMLKIIMASNEDWVVDATEDERRYFVLNVSDIKCGDIEYFEQLHRWIDAGGAAAFLDYLLKLDIADFNIRKVPATAALDQQKLLSLEPLEAWLYLRLAEGRVLKTDSEWRSKQLRDGVCSDFEEYARARGKRYTRTDSTTVGKRLRELLPSLRNGRESGGTRRYQWVFPSLEDARCEFATSMKLVAPGWPEAEPA